MKKTSKKLLMTTIASATGVLALGLAFNSINTNMLSALSRQESQIVPGYITLDNQNAVTTSGTHSIYTGRNNKIDFTYTNASGSGGNHVALASGGKIVNKDVIHSINKFVATFEGELQARLAYTTSTWGEYFDLVSGQTIDIGTRPYYLEMKAKTAVTLKSARFDFTCAVNSDAEEQDTEGDYTITFTGGGISDDATVALDPDDYDTYISSGNNYVTGFGDLEYVYAAANSNGGGLKLGKSGGAGYFVLQLSSTYVTEKITSIDVWTKKYSSDTGKLKITVNGNGESVSGDPTSSGADITLSLTNPTTVSSVTLETTSKRAYINKVVLHYGGKTEPGAPAPIEVGFSATDSNKNSYTTNSIFDSDNGLSVYSLMSDGSKNSLAKGGSNGYSYVIKDENNQIVDSSDHFGKEGNYTLTVSYRNYITVVIDLTVGEYIFIEDITLAMTSASFTTADKMSEHLSNNLEATITYSNGTTKVLGYDSFTSNNLKTSLLTPRGITYDQTVPFGTEGNWTILVTDLNDEDVSGSFKISVSAIMVETITLNETSYTLYPAGTLQLLTTINPTTATNDAVYWTSNNETVATVSETGLVTAVAIGGAKITVTAADGSGVVAHCNITVVSAPNYVSDTLTRSTTGITGTSYTSWSGKTGTSGAVYAGQSAGGNDSIQLRSNNDNSGIITTKSGGTIGKVIVDWNSNTSGRTLNVYGSNSAYSSPSELYSTSSQGTLLGTIDSDSQTELTITSSYKYVGVRSSSGALYMDSITFKWGETPAALPVYPTSIGLTVSSSTISIGETSSLTVTYSPNDTNVKNVTFSSSNTSVATVSESGIVTGVAAGTATITATAEAANNQTVTKTVSIAVKTIAVESISLSEVSTSIKVGRSVTLTPTILPSNATNKGITWSTSSSAIASVSNGVVTGVAAGTATITATTNDGNKTATCIVTVTASSASSSWELVTSASSLAAGDVLVLAESTNGVTNGNISSQIMGTASSLFSNGEITDLGEDTVQLTLGGSEGSWTLSNDDGQLLGATAAKKLAWDSGTTTWTISISGGDATIQSTNSTFGRFLYNSSNPRFTTYTSATSSSMLLPQLYRGGTAEPTDPTNILLDKSSIELMPGGNKTFSVSYIPSNANQNKEITWTSSNTNVATVSNGTVTAKSSATVGQTTTITATLTNLPTIKATCTVTIVESKLDDHTVMIYMCGADLESGTDEDGNVPTAVNASGLASGDIDEILKVTGQPDDVNIIIETGGANIWQSGHSFSISNSKLERWHIENRSLVKDASLNYANMGLQSTFQSFVEWGLNNYPAERVGVVLWNHGGGMRGVCYDEKKGDDSLLNSEISGAIKSAFTNTGRSTSNKLEWIGYDACLMAVQDVAEFNSKYFNYQMSSEESEAGYGWDYDNWVDNLYLKQSTTQILKEIADTFITDNGGVNKRTGDQTQSYLNLAYASEYKDAWEALAAQLNSVVTSSNKSSFNSAIVNKVKHFADSDYDYFCLFDAKDFINQLVSNSAFSSFRVGSSYTDAVLNAFDKLVAYSTVQKGAGNAYGLCMYWPNSTDWSNIGTYYTTSQTNFTTWRSFCESKGYYKN